MRSLADATLTATLLPLTASVATYYIVNTTLLVGAIAVLASLAIVNGAWIWLPAAAVPLFVCYRLYGIRWRGMAPASISR